MQILRLLLHDAAICLVTIFTEANIESNKNTINTTIPTYKLALTIG